MGAGIANEVGATITLTATLSGNTVNIEYNGGGIDNYGTLTVSNSTLSGNAVNSLESSPGRGGGIAIDGGRATISETIVARRTRLLAERTVPLTAAHWPRAATTSWGTTAA